MKYPIGQQTVDAIYDNSGSGNPLIEALPDSLEQAHFFEAIQEYPVLPESLNTPTRRKRALSQLSSLFVPLDYMYPVYDSLVRMMETSYHTLTSKESVIRMNKLFASGGCIGGYGTQAQSGSLLGTPGLGKTSTVKRCLILIPQVIAHEKYLRKPFFCKQVLWLFVECPSDASQKTMAYNIVRALDLAVGGNHLDYLMRSRSSASSAVATYIKVLCMTYHVGLLVIDEIQNVVSTAQRTNKVKPLVRFLTELTNDTCTSIYFVGTTLAETVFQSEEYLRRRTRGPRLLPFKPDHAYRDFLSKIWPYQVTVEQAEPTDKLANVLYDYSGGIPAYITRIFEKAQALALIQDAIRIDDKLIRQAAEYLSIEPPRELGTGTFISDISVSKGSKSQQQAEETESFEIDIQVAGKPAIRQYANKRGRKSEKRDAADLIEAYKSDMVIAMLKQHHLYEELVIC